MAPPPPPGTYPPPPNGGGPRPSMPPSAGGTVASGAKLDKAIQDACKILDAIFKAHLDDDWIRYSLIFVWSQVHYAIEQAGDSNLEKRRRKKDEFDSYVTPGSDQERKLINLVRSMAKHEVPWKDLLQNGTLLSSLWPSTLIIIFYF